MRTGDGTRALPPAHLTHSRDAADMHRVGVRAERHAEGSVARKEDIVVAARHALGVHGEVAARLGRRAPQVWVKPREAVGISEEQRGAYGCRQQLRRRAEPGARRSTRHAHSSHASRSAPETRPLHLSLLSYRPGPSRLLQR